MSDTFHHIEFETKYNATDIEVADFMRVLDRHKSACDFIGEHLYQNIQDDYYTSGGEFIRHRYSERYGSNTLTWKKKLRSGDNIIRKEINLELKHCSKPGIERGREFIHGIGFKHNFTIKKPVVVIYEFKDIYIPYYSVVDEDGNLSRFIEIEIKEDKIHKYTEEQAWSLIREWEQKLTPLGISCRKRLKKSIYEMYNKEPVNE